MLRGEIEHYLSLGCDHGRLEIHDITNTAPLGEGEAKAGLYWMKEK